MKVSRLGDHATFLSGFAFKSDLFNSDGLGMPVIRVRDVVRGRSKTFYLGSYDERYLVNEGEYLIGMDGEFNLSRWRSSPALLNQRVCKIDRTSEELDRDYLSRFLAVALKKIEDETPFVTVKHLSAGRLTNTEIPLPPLPEQKRIARILDAADALRAKRRESLVQLDTLLQSTFLDLFGDLRANPFEWEISEIGKHLKVFGGFAFQSADFRSDGLPIIRISNLAGDRIDLSSCARVPKSIVDKGSRFKIEPGDTLIAMSGATTGKIGYVPDDLDEEWYLNQRVGAFRMPSNTSIHRDYLRVFLKSSFYTEHIWNLAGGAAQPNISGKQLESAKILLPPLDLQRRFARIVTAIES